MSVREAPLLALDEPALQSPLFEGLLLEPLLMALLLTELPLEPSQEAPLAQLALVHWAKGLLCTVLGLETVSA